MLRRVGLLLFSISFIGTVWAQKMQYPETRKGEIVENYHGTEVADPFRWLEDLDSEETHAWVEAQNKVTFSYLDQIPERK